MKLTISISKKEHTIIKRRFKKLVAADVTEEFALHAVFQSIDSEDKIQRKVELGIGAKKYTASDYLTLLRS